MVRLVSIVLSLALAAPPAGDAPEVPPEITDVSARAHFSAGMTAWLDEDYATAQRELEAAYTSQAVPLLLYSLGQLARVQGDCERAREHFLAYLATDPPARETENTRVNLERCKASVPEPPVAEPPPPKPVALDDPLRPSEPPPRARPDGLGIGLTVGGAVLAITGAALFGSAFARQRQAQDESDVDSFERAVRGANAQYWSGVALLSAGGAVLIGGIVRLAIAGRKAGARDRRSR
jgi:hypothetical protein